MEQVDSLEALLAEVKKQVTEGIPVRVSPYLVSIADKV